MTFPGPSGPVWGLGLLALAIAVAGLGELVRQLLARRVPLLASLEPIERGLLDLYLGGAVFYVIAAVPFPLFYPATVLGVLVGGAVALVLVIVRSAHDGELPRRVAAALAPLRTGPYLLALAVTIGLFIVELSAIEGVGSGNTYDASLLSTYTGLLLAHHTLPLSLAPVATDAISYPQGTTVWLAVAQGLFGLPPIRTSLLVTPLFLALAPLGAFAFGRRLGGTAWVGASMALVVGLLATFTRGLVAGSNDFVFAVPLVLLLAAWSIEWTRPQRLGLADAIAFGALAGYAAALNPVGPIWLFLALPVLALVARPRFAGDLRRWVIRWASAVLASLVLLLPSLEALLAAPSSAGLSGGASGTTTALGGESLSRFLGDIDPFLFRSQDQSLSPFPLLRAELALLLVGGVLLLALGRNRFGLSREFAPVMAGLGATLIGLLAVGVPANAGVAPFAALYRFTSAGELSALLFLLYCLLAAIPLVVAVGALFAATSTSGSRERGGRRGDPWRVALPALLAVAIVLPGLAVTTTQLPDQLRSVYTNFSDVTPADLDLLDWAPGHLPSSSRVLVAPGSVAEFLPAYDPTVVLLYPMTLGFLTAHPAYWTVVDELTNGTLNATGRSALAGLGAEYVVVTENNTALFRPLDPAPLEAALFPIVFQEGGVYVFDVRGA